MTKSSRFRPDFTAISHNELFQVFPRSPRQQKVQYTNDGFLLILREPFLYSGWQYELLSYIGPLPVAIYTFFLSDIPGLFLSTVNSSHILPHHIPSSSTTPTCSESCPFRSLDQHPPMHTPSEHQGLAPSEPQMAC